MFFFLRVFLCFFSKGFSMFFFLRVFLRFWEIFFLYPKGPSTLPKKG